MKVKEMIERLGEVDGDLPVVVYKEYENEFRVLDDSSVSVEAADDLSFVLGGTRVAVIHA